MRDPLKRILRRFPVTHHALRITAIFWSLVLSGIAFCADAPTLLTNAFAHNDYEHSRPLLDALDAGFCGIEADIHLVDGQLLVGHDAKSLRPDRTLAALYLDPLRERVRANRGRVYANGPEVLLLIDIKTEAEATYDALRSLLRKYEPMLTVFTSNTIRTNAITIILSGNRPVQTISNEITRLVAIDGRLPDLESKPPVSLVPLVSDNWSKLFEWKGVGAITETERLRLQQMVARAHEQGRKLRLWAAPDTPTSWRLQQQMGLDWINTDNLTGLAQAKSERR